MSEGFPDVQVAVVVVMCGDRILTYYNPRWEAFTLPMTKWQPQEPWINAAARAAAECLGRPLDESEIIPVPDFSVPHALQKAFDADPYLHVDIAQQSLRNGVERIYHFKVFTVNLKAEGPLADGCIGGWLTIDEMLEGHQRPLSPSVEPLIRQFVGQGILGGKFPPGTAP